MDWNNINTDRDTSGLGPIEYDQSRVPSLIRKYADDVRTKTYGQEVREAQARNAEYAGLIASEANSKATNADILSKDTQNRFDDQIAGTTNSDEVIDARRAFGSESAFQTLGERLDFTDTKISDHEVTPDDFEGENDNIKLQAALNYVRHNQVAIRLTKMYDLTGLDPVYVRKGSTFDRRPVTFIGAGGGFIKKDTGFMISSETNNMGDIIFIGVKFESVDGAGATVFDSSKLIRYSTVACTFTNIDGIDKDDATKGYVQSIRHLGDYITGGKGSAMSVHGARDISVNNCLVENRENFFEQVDEAVEGIGEIGQARFRDNVIEGLSGFAYKFHTVDKLTIDGEYFEANVLGNIIFYNPQNIAGQAQLNGVTIDNCRNSTKDSTSVLVKFAGNLNNVSTSGNKSHGAPLFDFSQVTIDNAIRSRNDVSTHENILGINGVRNIDDGKVLVYDMKAVPVPANTSKVYRLQLDFDLRTTDEVSVKYQNTSANQTHVTVTTGRNFSDPKVLQVYVRNTSVLEVVVPDIFITIRLNSKNNAISKTTTYQ